MANYFPLCVNLENRKCLVIGAGSVALLKIHDLLMAKADITVISRAAHPGVLEYAESGAIKLVERPYQREDIHHYDPYLIIAATNDEKLHAKLYREAEKRHILFNAVNDINLCNFIIPTTVLRGDLSIGISTNGQTPFLSQALGTYLMQMIGEEWGEIVTFGKILRRRNKEGLASREERQIFSDFWASPLGIELKSGDQDKALTFVRDYIKTHGNSELT